MNVEQLREPARRLRARAPEEWDGFVETLRVYVAEVVDAVSEAEADRIMEMKGRAQDCKALLRAWTTLDPPEPLFPRS
jgi:hypothetical protein